LVVVMDRFDATFAVRLSEYATVRLSAASSLRSLASLASMSPSVTASSMRAFAASRIAVLSLVLVTPS